MALFRVARNGGIDIANDRYPNSAARARIPCRIRIRHEQRNNGMPCACLGWNKPWLVPCLFESRRMRVRPRKALSAGAINGVRIVLQEPAWIGGMKTENAVRLQAVHT